MLVGDKKFGGVSFAIVRVTRVHFHNLSASSIIFHNLGSSRVAASSLKIVLVIRRFF